VANSASKAGNFLHVHAIVNFKSTVLIINWGTACTNYKKVLKELLMRWSWMVMKEERGDG
jgi:hypothetical protein